MKANNIYDKTSPSASDKGKGKHNQVMGDFASRKVVTSHDECDPSTAKQRPNPNQDHKGFQMGTNPMYESSFEKSLIEREKKERELARERYVAGIQGTDGGKKPYECYNINN